LAARLIGSFLASVELVPEIILSSSAVRARNTAEIVKESGNWSTPIITLNQLYGAGPASILELIRQQDNTIGKLMLVGHNPTWESLAHHLIGGGDLRFPTAALARIKMHGTDWNQLNFGQGTLSWLITPKLLKKLS
jgi:phosphohistidine phosphatase